MPARHSEKNITPLSPAEPRLSCGAAEKGEERQGALQPQKKVIKLLAKEQWCCDRATD